MSRRHRRIKRDRLQTIYICNRTVTKDSEGVPTESYHAAYGLKAEVWPATERRQIEMYGDRITGISNVRIVGEYTVNGNATEGITMKRNSGLTNEVGSVLVSNDGQHLVVENTIAPGDGVCVYVDGDSPPDFRVLTITPYKPVRMEIERI